MRFCQLRLMAVAGSAPHLSAAAASACTQRELLGVTDHLQATCGGRSDSINSEDIFQALPRMEVADALAGDVDFAKLALDLASLARFISLDLLQTKAARSWGDPRRQPLGSLIRRPPEQEYSSWPVQEVSNLWPGANSACAADRSKRCRHA